MPKDSDEEVDIVIKYEKEYRTLDELDKILVEGKNGPVSLSLFVNRKPVNKTGKIARKNSTRSKSIKFDVTEGTDAQATVSVRIEEKGKTTVGQAADTDTLVASANAYLSALNKLKIKREKTAPDPSLSAQI